MSEITENKLRKINEEYKKSGLPFTDLLSTNEVWWTLENNCLSDPTLQDIRILFALGAAGYANRLDWSDGYSKVEDVFYSYANEIKSVHPDVYDEYSSVLESDDEPDGRIFRDMSQNFDKLFGDARSELEFVDNVDDKTRKALLKIFTPGNIKAIVGYEVENMM